MPSHFTDRAMPSRIKTVKLALVTSFMSAAHAVMGRAQLRNVKWRAERLATVG
jgi:hypothetical protein